MKTSIKFLLTLCLLLIGLVNFAQNSNTFRLTDINVVQGQTLELKDNQVFCTFARVLINAETIKTIDSIVDFLNNNPKVSIEIAVHSDQRGSAEANLSMTQKRAQFLKFQICQRGSIDCNRIIAKGY